MGTHIGNILYVRQPAFEHMIYKEVTIGFHGLAVQHISEQPPGTCQRRQKRIPMLKRPTKRMPTTSRTHLFIEGGL